jgi:hypothetical protein
MATARRRSGGRCRQSAGCVPAPAALCILCDDDRYALAVQRRSRWSGHHRRPGRRRGAPDANPASVCRGWRRRAGGVELPIMGHAGRALATWITVAGLTAGQVGGWVPAGGGGFWRRRADSNRRIRVLQPAKRDTQVALYQLVSIPHILSEGVQRANKNDRKLFATITKVTRGDPGFIRLPPARRGS